MSLYNVDYLALGDCIQNPSMSVIAILQQLFFQVIANPRAFIDLHVLQT